MLSGMIEVLTIGDGDCVDSVSSLGLVSVVVWGIFGGVICRGNRPRDPGLSFSLP